MTKSFCIASLLLACAATGCSGSASAPNKPRAWTTYASPDGKFSIDFPGQPLAMPVTDGNHKLALEFPNGELFFVSYSDDPDYLLGDTDLMLQAAGDSQLKGNSQLMDRRLELLGNPAREFAYTDADNDAIHTQLLFVKDRLYQLIVLVKSARYEQHADERQRFLGSFKLTSP